MLRGQRRLAFGLIAAVAVTTSGVAVARGYSHHYHHVSRHHRGYANSYRHHGYARRDRGHYYHHYAGGYGGGFGPNESRARAQGLPTCGAHMADLFGFVGSMGRKLWLAANWANVGTPTSPHPGAVAVWPHHVAKIVGGPDSHGRYLVTDNHGRGGHADYYRSLRGAKIVQVASR